MLACIKPMRLDTPGVEIRDTERARHQFTKCQDIGLPRKCAFGTLWIIKQQIKASQPAVDSTAVPRQAKLCEYFIVAVADIVRYRRTGWRIGIFVDNGAQAIG